MPAGFTVLANVSDIGRNYEIRRDAGGSIYCTCPPWRQAVRPRHCRHTREYERQLAEERAASPQGGEPGRPDTVRRAADALGLGRRLARTFTPAELGLLEQAVQERILELAPAAAEPEARAVRRIVLDR